MSRAQLAFWLVCLGCSGNRSGLRVDVRTDLVPGDEFSSVRVQIFEALEGEGMGAETNANEVAVSGQDWFGGVRLIDADLASGDYEVVVRALDASGAAVLPDARLRATVRGRVAHTFRLARECLGQVECSPRDCTSAADCPDTYECGAPACIESTCLYAFDDSQCASGECTPAGCVVRPDSGLDAPIDSPGVDGGCPVGFADCNLDPSDGCEAMLGTELHCSECGDLCVADSVISGSFAQCAGGACELGCLDFRRIADCNGDVADGCETDLTLPDNCGGCGIRCSGATPFCGVTGASPSDVRTCVSSCLDPTPVECGGTCIAAARGLNDILYSPTHCGGCDALCTAPDECCGGCCDRESGCVFCG